MRLPFSLLIGAVVSALSPSSQAAVGKDLAIHSRAGALGGAYVSGKRDGASAFTNPAAMASPESNASRLSVHWSLLYSHPEFKAIPSVTVENDFVSDRTRSGSVDTDYPDTFGQSLGVVYQMTEAPTAWSLGFLAYLPLGHLARLDTGEAFIPEYVRYRSRNQAPEFALALAVKPVPTFSLGLGVRLGASLNSTTTVFIQTDAAKASTMRLSGDLNTKATPYLGILLEPSSDSAIGLVVRAPLAQPATINVRASARALGALSAWDFSYPALSTLYYDPWSIELGANWKYSAAHRIWLEFDAELWSKYESPTLAIGTPDVQSGPAIATSKNPKPGYKNVFIPRIGHESQMGDLTWRAGYAYRTSMVDGAPTGIGNPLDPALHQLSAGVGVDFKRFLHFNTPCRLDFHLAYSILENQSVVKSRGNEAGNAADVKIGSPGYEAGGNLWGGGVSLNLPL